MYTNEEIQRLKPYVTNLDRDVYCLKNLPPEVLAVLFAYVSRSPASFRDNLLKLLQDQELAMPEGEMSPAMTTEKTRRFHEKWVVGYGHSSVAEHAEVKFALENVSIIASKVIEDNRLGAFTEKSTRYQRFTEDRFYLDPHLAESEQAGQIRDLTGSLYELYHQAYEPVFGHVAGLLPPAEGMSRSAWENSVRARTLDIIRYLLPAGTMTAIGISLNGRAASHAISKLLSHPLHELRELGKRMRTEGREVLPTLMRHADASDYLHHNQQAGQSTLPEQNETAENGVALVDFDRQGVVKVLAGLLYPDRQQKYTSLLEEVAQWPREKQKRLLKQYFSRRDPYQAAPRALELANYTMEMLLDYGAFRDVQRHRIATQINPLPTVVFGYEMPEEFLAVGLEKRYHQLMDRVQKLVRELSVQWPMEASYLVPLAFRKRVLFQWNLREIYHFVELRSSAHGHESYRRIAQQVYQLVHGVHPLLAGFMRVDLKGYSLGRLSEEQRNAES